MRHTGPAVVLLLTTQLLAAGTAAAMEPDPMEIARAAGDIVIDGDISDGAWHDAPEVDVWFETNPGDNVEPKVASKAWLLYDDQFLYVAFDFADPEPEKVRAPLGDHDNLPGYTDYGGVIIDASNDGKTAQMFLANARGIKYDAISSDTTGEDSAPDYFWDAAGRVHGGGWSMEMRIPLSSIRYSDPDWRVMLYRNYPRDRRYQMFTSRLPRDVNCFICNSRPLNGLTDLPTGGHYIVAPVLTANQSAAPEGEVGTPLRSGDAAFEPSVDLKWLPTPNTVVDATVNPDFSQVESDTAQITANERFALFVPEKRPFFLEGADLLQTPISAVHTRTFTAPRWGARVTGTAGRNAYTFLAGQDKGGGSVILPGARGSALAEQDFDSTIALGRWRRDVGERSFVSFLVTDREAGSASNRVFGPDFQWRPNDHDRVSGQLLYSRSRTPVRPDLAEEWNGQTLDGHAAELSWSHRTDKEDWYLLYEDYDEGFRADNGFVPQVGYREGFASLGYTFRPGRGLPEKGFLSRLRVFTWNQRQEDRQGNLLSRYRTVGAGMDGRWSSFWQVQFQDGEVESGGRLFDRRQVRLTAQVTPSRRVPVVALRVESGDDVDFAHARPATSVRTSLDVNLQPSQHLALSTDLQQRALDVDGGRLFTADLARLRAIYTFNSKTWMRLVTQWVSTRRDPGLYSDEVEARSASLSGSVVFAYKLNWQSVLYLGYGDERALDLEEELRPAGRQLFLKVSYALQR